MKRPLAYITAAWCGSDHENTKLAAQYCRTVYEAGFSPICPTLYQPLFLNDATDGISWVEHGVKKSQIYKRNSRTGEGAPKIWEYMQELIDKHVEKGHVIGDI